MADASRPMKLPPGPKSETHTVCVDIDGLFRDFKAQDTRYDGMVSRRGLYRLMVKKQVRVLIRWLFCNESNH